MKNCMSMGIVLYLLTSSTSVGSYGRVEWGPMMACIVLAILPIVVLYLLGQKHIIKGVLSGAVKG